MTDPEAYLTCPYNPVHRILAKRMATHLVKCKKSQKSNDVLAECLFNATHKISESELKHHLTICPDRINFDKHVYVPEDCNRSKFPLPLVEVEGDENWDHENIPCYNPEEYCKSNLVLRQNKIQSASKRRDFRFEERQRIQKLQDMAPVNTHTNENSRRSMLTQTSLAAQSSRILEEDNPYTVEKLQEKVRLGGQQVMIAQSSARVETKVRMEDPEELADKFSGLNTSAIRKIGKGRGRDVAK